MMQETQLETNAEAIAGYYNAELNKPLRDFVLGNSRIQAAIDRCLTFINPSTHTLLDVGCGIGFSAATFRREKPWVAVTAVDISSKRIECGQRLFEDQGIRFQVSDMTAPPIGGPFDVITMLDVYEHIPVTARPRFHQTLSNALTSNGTVVLSLPSRHHQHHLSEFQPESLQVVDETILLNDLVKLADDLKGELVLYQLVSIWRANDYIHAAIRRNPRYEPVQAETSPNRVSRLQDCVSRLIQRCWGSTRNNDERLRRKHLVANKLGIKIE
jgi:2-polyprenyl-3-methyl-5-hydroxy-6-metoxy-1,4-benzoquinol methylase